MKDVMFHVKHSQTGKAKEYGVVHVQIDVENQTVWFALVDKDGNFSIIPSSVCKFVKAK